MAPHIFKTQDWGSRNQTVAPSRVSVPQVCIPAAWKTTPKFPQLAWRWTFEARCFFIEKCRGKKCQLPSQFICLCHFALSFSLIFLCRRKCVGHSGPSVLANRKRMDFSFLWVLPVVKPFFFHIFLPSRANKHCVLWFHPSSNYVLPPGKLLYPVNLLSDCRNLCNNRL